MTDARRNGIFGVPGGQVTIEIPDGVTKTFADGEMPNSLTNSDWAHGGPDGAGYGAFPCEDDSNVPSLPSGRSGGRFRIR